MFKKKRFIAVEEKIAGITGKNNIYSDDIELMAYSYDAGISKAIPEAVISFDNINQIAPVIKILYQARIPFLPRLAGTNLSGGTIPLKSGVILNLSRLNKIYQIDTTNNIAVVEPGAVNINLQKELEKFGYFYAPDPSSQKVCTIGGNIGENAGGPQCLKYGVTSNNIAKLQIITPEGDEITLSENDIGPDLMSLFIGSEGTLGIAIKAWLKIIPKPKIIKTCTAAFLTIEDSINAATKIIEAGIMPRALEAMDKTCVDASKNIIKSPYPEESEAMLIIELDCDYENKLEEEIQQVKHICDNCFSNFFRIANTETESEALWAIRKGAYPAMARLAPNVLVEDGVVPRPKLPEALKKIKTVINEYNLKASILFHAGDGNIHPNIIFDERDIKKVKIVKKAGYEILKICIDLGGSISGEHGIGIEKRVAMNWLYPTATLELFQKIKKSFDPENLSNPDKIVPVSLDSRKTISSKKYSPDNKILTNLLNEVKSKYREGVESIIIGSNSNLNKNIKSKSNILKLDELSEIIDLDRENFTVKAEAGIKISRLKELLKASKLYPALPDYKGTLGGLIAANHFKGIKDILLGIDIMTSNGEIHSFGGKTLKNVAGYDVVKLFIGSMGAYGIILNATIKLDSKNRLKDIKTKEPNTVEKNPFFFDFKPGKYQKRLKNVFDPKNLFNSWLYGDNQNESEIGKENIFSFKEYALDKLHKQNELFKLDGQNKNK
ncbi:MAG: FAD-binding oxidoreductase [Elusimicrobia bacterium]|nr:FAD-binding oxidoreductase [Elusimicrobiota bacterium]